MPDHGISISSYGNDALTQDEKKRVYTSKFSTPKIFRKGMSSLTTNGAGTGTKKIFHGLGYTPTFLVFNKGTATNSFLDASSYTNAFFPIPGTSNAFYAFHKNIFCYTDKEYLYFVADSLGSTQTLNFRYYIFIDQAQFNDADGLQTTDEHGIKITKNNEDVFNAEEQKVSLSSAYKTLGYYPNMVVDYPSLTLPELFGDFFDQTPQEGTYIDFFHELDYPPFFLAYAQETGTQERTILPVANQATIFGSADFSLASFCTRERIRIVFYRRAQYNASPSLRTTWDATSFDIKLYVFAEDLSEE